MQFVSKDYNAGLSSSGPARSLGAFTLIEILVVTAIIALLLALLLPSLQAARDQARLTQCLTNQRSIALAMRLYLDCFDGALPGSPNTSGVGPQLPTPDTAVATSAFDYASPLLAFLNQALPPNRARRQELTRQGIFKCPANNYQFMPWPDSPTTPDKADFSTTQAASYLTCWNFFLAGDAYVANHVAPGVEYWLYGATWTEKLPRKYLPKITNIGLPAQKIFLADGARYIDNDGNYTYDTGYDFFGAGSYSGSGAWWAGSREYGPNSPAAPYSYRHNDGLAAAFYDGHCEYISQEQSRRAVYWYPRGTVITDTSQGAGTEPDGYIVP